MGAVGPAMLTRPIAAAQPSDVMAPNAATMVPRTEGREAPAALRTTAVLSMFRFRAGACGASTDESLLSLEGVRLSS